MYYQLHIGMQTGKLAAEEVGRLGFRQGGSSNRKQGDKEAS